MGLNSANNLPENPNVENLKVENLKVEGLESDREELKKDDLLWNPMFPQVFTPNTSEKILTKTMDANEVRVEEGAEPFENLTPKAPIRIKDSKVETLDPKQIQIHGQDKTQSKNFEQIESLEEPLNSSATVKGSVVGQEKQEYANVSRYSSQPVQNKVLEYLPEVKEKLALSQVKKYFTEQKRVEGETEVSVYSLEQKPIEGTQPEKDSFSKPVRIRENAPKNQLETTFSKNNGEQITPQVQSPISTQVFDSPKMTMTVSKAEVPELMSKVQTLAQSGGGKMVVTLNPPHLGEVEVSVTTKGKKVEIEMISENSASKSILESHFSELKNSIQAQDMVVSKFEVSVTKDFDLGSMRSQDFANLHSQNSDSRGSFSQSSGQQANKQQPFLTERHILSERADFKPAASIGRVDLKI